MKLFALWRQNETSESDNLSSLELILIYQARWAYFAYSMPSSSCTISFVFNMLSLKCKYGGRICTLAYKIHWFIVPCLLVIIWSCDYLVFPIFDFFFSIYLFQVLIIHISSKFYYNCLGLYISIFWNAWEGIFIRAFWLKNPLGRREKTRYRKISFLW